MTVNAAHRIVASVRKASSARAAAAREAFLLCQTFDQLAYDAVSSIDDPERFADLLAQRDDVLALLNDHLITLRLERPTADGPQYAGAERAADAADDLIIQVRESLEASLAATSVLTARVAERAAELRQEIAAVNRGGSARHAYTSQQTVAHLQQPSLIMEITSEIATREEASNSPFGAILRETISEMENAEALELAFEDVVQRLSLAAHHTLTAQAGGPLPRVGGYAYLKSTVTPPEKNKSQLDVRY